MERRTSWITKLKLKNRGRVPSTKLENSILGLIPRKHFDTSMARLGKSGDKAAYLFNRDDQDSDGDGLTNLEERAFGGDSLMSDQRSNKPSAIRKGDGYEYITFKRYQDAFNTGDDRIEYIVETSRDLRTWTSDSDTTNGPLQVGTAIDHGWRYGKSCISLASEKN